MRSTIGLTFFTVGETPYLWADVILAAELWGEWSPIVERAKAGLAAFEREAAGEESLVDDAEIEAEADRFRYERDLVSVDDTERWLGTWSLDVDQWLNWIRMDLLRKRFELEAGAAGTPEVSGELDTEELEDAVYAEAVFSGALGRFARRLAAHAAIAQKLSEGKGPDVATAEETVETPPVPHVDAARLLPGFPPEDVPERVRGIVRSDRAFLGFRDEVVTPEAVAARVRIHQGDWMRVDCRILELPTEDVAREALLSIQEDGEDMSEVAAGANAEIREGTFYLEELEHGLSDHVLAAQKGELLGPLRSGDRYVLIEVLDKRLASVDDEEIRARAEESLFDSLVEREMEDRVSWRWGR